MRAWRGEPERESFEAGGKRAALAPQAARPPASSAHVFVEDAESRTIAGHRPSTVRLVSGGKG